MSKREYYAFRKGITKPNNISFDSFKGLFLKVYKKLKTDLYFHEAEGWKCVDKGHISGIWGSNTSEIALTFLSELGMDKVYPIEYYIDKYDEPKLFSVIEFLYDYVSEPQKKEYHRWDDCGWHPSEYDKEKGKKEYLKRINEILIMYSSGYELSKTGEIQQIAPTGMETLLEEDITTRTPDAIEGRIHHAKDKFRRYNASINDKRDAIRELAAVLEFLRKEGVVLPKKDDSDLSQIMNQFDIRHHNKFQQGDYNKDAWYDWIFYTTLASINTLLKLKKL